MIKRTIEVSTPAALSVRRNQLIIKSEETGEHSVPIEDLGILLLSNPAISVSHRVHSACVQHNATVVFCDEKFLPAGIPLPLSGNHLAAKVFGQQLALSEPKKKRFWQAIVCRKIAEQSKALDEVGGDGGELRKFICKVKSGDTSNMEAQAARQYWSELFGKGFRRRPDAPGINVLLNYGYAVIRAAVARGLVGAGLNPLFGLKHSNQYNSMPLVDDLMEPFRAWVDVVVWSIMRDSSEDAIQTLVLCPSKNPLN
jgi:CRISPR-associated protein Cas1